MLQRLQRHEHPRASRSRTTPGFANVLVRDSSDAGRSRIPALVVLRPRPDDGGRRVRLGRAARLPARPAAARSERGGLPELARRIGLGTATALVVGGTIGVGHLPHAGGHGAVRGLAGAAARSSGRSWRRMALCGRALLRRAGRALSRRRAAATSTCARRSAAASRSSTAGSACSSWTRGSPPPSPPASAPTRPALVPGPARQSRRPGRHRDRRRRQPRRVSGWPPGRRQRPGRRQGRGPARCWSRSGFLSGAGDWSHFTPFFARRPGVARRSFPRWRAPSSPASSRSAAGGRRASWRARWTMRRATVPRALVLGVLDRDAALRRGERRLRLPRAARDRAARARPSRPRRAPRSSAPRGRRALGHRVRSPSWAACSRS